MFNEKYAIEIGRIIRYLDVVKVLDDKIGLQVVKTLLATMKSKIISFAK